MSTREEREHWRAKGAHMTLGVIVCLSLLLVWTYCVTQALIAWGWSDGAYDDTDHPSGERSNMALRTDHGTGCQYLETLWGGITPRLNSDGKQICEETDDDN